MPFTNLSFSLNYSEDSLWNVHCTDKVKLKTVTLEPPYEELNHSKDAYASVYFCSSTSYHHWVGGVIKK